MRKTISLHRNARITNDFLKNIGVFWVQSTVDLLYSFLTVSAFVSVVVKPVMNAIVQVRFGVRFRAHTLFLFCLYLSRCLDIRCSTARVPWGFGLQGARAPWALVRSGVSAVPCRMLDGRDRWFPVGFLAVILIDDCGDVCWRLGAYII